METEVKNVLDSIKGSVESIGPRIDKMQMQLDAVDEKTQRKFVGEFQSKGLAEEVFENAEFKRMGEMGGRGRATIKIADFQKKTLTNTAAGSSTSGVLAIDR